MSPTNESSAPSSTRRVAFVEPGKNRYYSVAPTPVGQMLLVSDGDSLVELQLPSFAPWDDLSDVYIQDDALLDPVAREIAAYFEGDLVEFSIPLAPLGTPFQRDVWRALLDITYGTTATYGEIAANVGRPKAQRAVGMANHANPIALIIPCHRVIGASGSLTGHGGGLPLKAALLDLEAACSRSKEESNACQTSQACAWVLRSIGRDGFLLGALLGLLHGLFVATALVNVLLPIIHPRMGSSFTAANSSPLIESPGFLMLNYGTSTFVVSIVDHVAYGALVGGFLQLAH